MQCSGYRLLIEPQKKAEYNPEKRIRIHDHDRTINIPATGGESEETQVLQHITLLVQTVNNGQKLNDWIPPRTRVQ